MERKTIVKLIVMGVVLIACVLWMSGIFTGGHVMYQMS